MNWIVQYESCPTELENSPIKLDSSWIQLENRDERRNPIDFFHRVKGYGQIGAVYKSMLARFRLYTVKDQSLSNFKCKMRTMRWS